MIARDDFAATGKVGPVAAITSPDFLNPKKRSFVSKGRFWVPNIGASSATIVRFGNRSSMLASVTPMNIETNLMPTVDTSGGVTAIDAPYEALVNAGDTVWVSDDENDYV